MNTKLLSLVLVAAVALSACWDDDDAEEQTAAPPTPQDGVPSSALASSRAYTMYAATFSSAETGAAPVTLSDYVAPTSETEAPEPVN